MTTSKLIRKAWDEGINLARAMGGDAFCLNGKEKERRFRHFLERVKFDIASNALAGKIRDDKIAALESQVADLQRRREALEKKLGSKTIADEATAQ